MSKALKLSLCFGTTLVSWAVAVGVIVSSVKGVIEDNKPLATIEAPGSATFTIEEPATVTIWHDYVTVWNGTVISNEPELPTGYSFDLVAASGERLPPMSISGSSMMHVGGTSKKSVGSFDLPAKGTYVLTVTAPAEPRIISASTGSFGKTFGKILGIFAAAAVLGILGLVTLIVGIVFAFSKPKVKAA